MATPVTLPKVDLILRPTPLHRLNRLSDELGIDLWIKRDDLTGFAMGGNKGRKLEYLIGGAKAQGVETIVTCGAAQSNFVRQLAVGCAMHRIKMVAIVMQLPYEYEPVVGAMKPEGGNLVLDELAGAEIRIIENGTWDELFETTTAATEGLVAQGVKALEIPIGGSTPQGAFSFYEAGLELLSQDDGFDVVLGASSSGSTQTGLTYAFHGTKTRFKGIACDPEPEMIYEFAKLSQGLDEITGMNLGIKPEDYDFDTRFVGPGYGVPSIGGMDAIQALAQKEGIFLDPIYSGKAFHGLIEMARSQELTGRVCFWHTGGTPSLFALPE